MHPTNELYLHGKQLNNSTLQSGYDLASHTIYVVCISFLCKVDSERQLFKKLLMAILFTLRFFTRIP